MSICLTLIVICEYFDLPSYLSVIIIVVYVLGYSLGSGPITWLYMADILPGTGISISTAVYWLFTVVVGLGFPWMKDTYSIVTTFIFFLICTLIGVIFIIVFIKETKGKD